MKKLGAYALILGASFSITGCGPDKPKAPATDAPKADMGKMEDGAPAVDHSKMKMDEKDKMPAEAPTK